MLKELIFKLIKHLFSFQHKLFQNSINYKYLFRKPFESLYPEPWSTGAGPYETFPHQHGNKGTKHVFSTLILHVN